MAIYIVKGRFNVDKSDMNFKLGENVLRKDIFREYLVVL